MISPEDASIMGSPSSYKGFIKYGNKNLHLNAIHYCPRQIVNIVSGGLRVTLTSNAIVP